MCFSCIVSGSAIVSCSAAGPADAASPTGDGRSQLKLLAGPALHNGLYIAGVAINMPAGSHTYWKMPGDAGVPPVFSFAGSRNLRQAKVVYPAPRRISEAGLEAYGYLDYVLLPVEVTPIDPAQPVALDVAVDYAVCNTICIPAHGTGVVTLEPDAAGADVAAVEAALASVPTKASADEQARLVLTPGRSAAKPTWMLAWHGENPPDDIFADAADGYYFATRKTGAATWSLVADQVPDKAAWPAAISLTLARPSRSLVADETLDIPSATR